MELVDNEITNTLSIKQVIKLSSFFNTSPKRLLAKEDQIDFSNQDEITPSKLIEIINGFLRNNEINLEKFEDKVGWEIHWLLENPDELYDQPAILLEDLGEVLKIPWLDIVLKDSRF